MRLDFPRTIAAMLAIAAAGSAHLTMTSPKPFAPKNGALARDPLRAGQFPCRPEGDAATWYDRSGATAMAIGVPQNLTFDGTASHGGGSCQLALTTDLQPTITSSWQVILSIEGGCPTRDEMNPDTYQFTIPAGITPGEYVFAWAWVARYSGLREYYMNCAPVTVTAAKSKRDHDNLIHPEAAIEPRQAASVFPELFVANLADVNDCRTAESADVAYPNPGPNVVRPGLASNFKPITGSDLTKCTPKVTAKPPAPPAAGTSTTSSSSVGSIFVTEPPTSSAVSTASAPSSSSAAVTGSTFVTGASSSSVAVITTTPSPSTTTTTTASLSSAAATSSTFVTEASSTSGTVTASSSAAVTYTGSTFITVSPSSNAVSSPAATSSSSQIVVSTLPSSSSSSSSNTAVASIPTGFITPGSSTQSPPPATTPTTTLFTTTRSSISSSLSAAPSASGPVGNGGGALLTGSCSPEGLYNCNGASFQRCASGAWSPAIPLAQGTKCKLGQSANLWL
ncbi:mucin-3/17 [Microdochium nivale]|nr:mucin-3/17 [Microdochium nivale]